MSNDLSQLFEDAVQQPTADEMAGMGHSELLRLRQRQGINQNAISPYEHRAFARELVAEKPLMSVPLALAIPAYQIQKLLPKAFTGNQSRSEPSLDQVKQGYAGIADGLSQLLGIR